MTNVWHHRPDIDRDVAAIFDPFGNAVHTADSFAGGRSEHIIGQWIHTRVPILALVKSKALDKNYQIELEEYGETGAKDELG